MHVSVNDPQGTRHDARTPGQHTPRTDGHRLAVLRARLTPYQQVKRAERLENRAKVHEALRLQQKTMGLMGQAFANALSTSWRRITRITWAQAVFDAGIIAWCLHTSGCF